jgi:hypothetical protein
MFLVDLDWELCSVLDYVIIVSNALSCSYFETELSQELIRTYSVREFNTDLRGVRYCVITTPLLRSNYTATSRARHTDFEPAALHVRDEKISFISHCLDSIEVQPEAGSRSAM